MSISFKTICKALLSHAFSWRSLSAKPELAIVQRLPLTVDKRYYFTTDSGVYLLEGNVISRMLRCKTYGIAMNPDYFFFSIHNNYFSRVTRYDKNAFCKGHRHCQSKRLYEIKAFDMSDRIHGISLGKDGLWIANTGRNTLLNIDIDTGKILAEIPPFSDQFGTPLFYNVNHINSVHAYNGCILFVANRAGNQSIIGLLDGKRVTGFGYRNIGVHDIFLSSDSIYFCDTFGSSKGGRLICGKNMVDGNYFADKNYIVRGIAGDPDGELLIGNSFQGSRNARFSGNGSILVVREGKAVNEISLTHSAQVYQIIQEDGTFVTNGKRVLSADNVRDRLMDALGPPLIDGNIPDVNKYARLKWLRPK